LAATGTDHSGGSGQELSDVRIGLEICEDAWVAARPGAALALQGIDVILNPSASHFAFGKIRIRERFVLEGSRAFNASYIYSNLLGNESGRAIYDGGALIASGGALLARGPRFSYRDAVVTSAVIDIGATRMNQARTASYRPDITNTPAEAIHADFAWPKLERFETPHPESPTWELTTTLKEEEFTRAVTLGLFDYLRKSRSQGFVVSLSGGADSTAVSCLVAQAVQLAQAEIGLEELKKKLSFLRGIESITNVEDLIKRLLTCVYQASSNSSSTTREAVRQVAKALGATFHEFNISILVDEYTKMVEHGQSAEYSPSFDQQPLRGSGWLRDDGWRYQRGLEPNSWHRQSLSSAMAPMG